MTELNVVRLSFRLSFRSSTPMQLLLPRPQLQLLLPRPQLLHILPQVGSGIHTISLRANQYRCNAGRQKYTSSTVEKDHKLILEVKEQLEREHGNLPIGKYGRDDEEMILWFLKDRKFDVNHTASKLANAIKHDLLESEKLCVYLLEKALSQLPPGEEKMLGIFDLRGFTLQNGDLTFIKFLIDVFYNYYPKRIGQALFVDAPLIFQPGWNIVKPWLKSYADLVRFCSADVVREEYFTEETVPVDFRA